MTSGLAPQQQKIMDQLLLEAVSNIDAAHARLYVEKGADVNMSAGMVYQSYSRNGSNLSLNREAPLLHVVYAKGLNRDVTEFLLSEGVDIDARDANGNTVLMLAAKAGNFNAVKFLTARGADPMAVNNNGEVVLEEARGLMPYYHSDRQQIIDTLVSALPQAGQRVQREVKVAELPELPAIVQPTPLQQRLNKKFNP